MKAKKRNKLNGWHYLPRKIWADEIEWCRSWTNGSLTKMTNSLWQCVFCEKQKNERKGGGFYRRSARKTKRCFDPRYKPTERQHVSSFGWFLSRIEASLRLPSTFPIKTTPFLLISPLFAKNTLLERFRHLCQRSVRSTPASFDLIHSLFSLVSNFLRSLCFFFVFHSLF